MSKSTKTKSSSKTSKKNGKSIEDTYKKMEQHAHILKRSDMYVGSTKKETVNMWIFNEKRKEEEPPFIYKEIVYVPALYKIFDEILVNARDQVVRCLREKNKTLCTVIKVSIDKETGKISVWNNGPGIPVEEHKEHKLYVPSLIFGELLTGSNYDDDEQRTEGGRNGLGAKLANIFSSEFEVETLDSKNDKKFYQKFSGNMYNKGKPKITSAGGKKPYTKISFIPDLEKFGLKKLSSDIIALFKKRVYDVAMTTNIKVFYNDKIIATNSFNKYIDLYFPEVSEHKKVFDIAQKNWKVCVVYDPTDKMEHQTVSLVNGICTTRGGSHVEHVVGQITKKLKTIVEKKLKMAVKAGVIKQNLIFFIDFTTTNPDFDTQGKECLKTKVAEFLSTFKLTETFMKKIVKTGVVDNIVLNASALADASLSKMGKGRGQINYPKLYDAHRAHLKQGDCTLILTEGDSAKTFALSGLNVVGRDKYGVFPLKGKLLNVREKSTSKITDNEEIQAIIKIMGLEPKKIYTSLKGLRYGSIMILTDQDSVTSDTPLLLKNSDNQIEIKTIDDISDNWTRNINGKEYSTTDYKIWTETGWTNIKNVMRHKVKKNIYRVLTHTGIVDVTEDHSLLNMHGEKIAPKECNIGDMLLHSFPRFGDGRIDIPSNLENLTAEEIWKYASALKIQYYQTIPKNELIEIIQNMSTNEHLQLDCQFNIEADEAYVMGFFWADGTCDIASNEYSESRIFKLIINGGEKIFDIVEKYRNLFYDKEKKKCIPHQILNAAYEIRKNFFYGYYDGDGCKYHLETTGSRYFDIDGKIGAHGMYFLCKSLGYDVSINHNIKKPKVYTLTLTSAHQQCNPDAIKKIFCIGKTEQYVYDLETENHHFQAGVGQMVVHNTDGSHIKGLIINFIHFFWPSLVKYDGFIRTFATPLLKATKGKGKKKQTIQFTTAQEFNEWKKDKNDGKGWEIKYYKGLGTSSATEAQECFERLEEEQNHFFWESTKENNKKESKKKEKKKSKKIDSEFIDEESDIVSEEYKPKCDDLNEDAITLAFAKKREDDRKKWLNTFDPKIYIDNRIKKISFYDFIHKELIAFSVYDTARSVPNLMDGLKPGQRKVFFASVKKNIYDKEIKVAQLAGYISEHTHYHHGEVSLMETIIKMAQNFVGSNNINILLPNGQFGSRLCGGKDSASPRYIHTQLNNLGKKIFIEDDYDILEQQREDNDPIEPMFYAPIIPMILVNGAGGIGTGYSSTIEPCNPRDIYKNIKRIMEGDKPKTMKPWYRHFTGTIEKVDTNKFISRANYEITAKDTIHVTDLPIGQWTDNYKEFLNNLTDKTKIKADLKNNEKGGKKRGKQAKAPARGSKRGSKKNSKFLAKKSKKSKTAKVAKKNLIGLDIKGYKENCTDVRVSFTITFNPGKLQKYIDEGTLEKYLKLASPISLTNMHLFDEKGKIKKFDSYGAILKNFCRVRLDLYQKRKDFLLDKWRKEMDILKWKLKFVENVISEKIIVFKNGKSKTTSQVIARLEELKFPQFILGEKKTPSYDYLTNMTILKFSEDEVEKLRKLVKNKKEEIETLEAKSPSQLWDEELEDFMEAYDKWEKEVDEEYYNLLNKKKGTKTTTKKKKQSAGKAEVVV